MLTESGLLYLKSGQTQHAFERLSAALALEPTCAQALLGIGCITQVSLMGFYFIFKIKLLTSRNIKTSEMCSADQNLH